MTHEKWAAVPGFAGIYVVSNFGRIKSIDRRNVNCRGVVRTLKGRALGMSRDSEGYFQVGLTRNGLETKARVHRLVASVFILNPQSLPVVDHINRDRSDNCVGNLRWASYSENRRNIGASAPEPAQ